MSDASSAGGAFASPVPFAGVDWPRLLMADYGTLEEAVRQRKQAVLNLLLDQCQIAGADRFVALRDALIVDILPVEVDLYLQCRAGAVKALTMSLAKAGKSVEDTGAAIGGLPFTEASKLARVLVGFMDLLPPEPDGADPFAASGTGAPTPPSSESSPASTPQV